MRQSHPNSSTSTSDSATHDKARFRAKQLFSFIETFSSIRSKVNTNFKEAGRFKDITEIRQSHLPGVVVSESSSDVILSVERTPLPNCPEPPQELKPWLFDNWNDAKLEAPSHRSFIEVTILPSTLPQAATEALEDEKSAPQPTKQRILFDDDPLRAKLWKTWTQKRAQWLIEYQRLHAAYLLYQQLYDWKSTLDKEGFLKGCFLCNGFVRSADGKIHYPLFLQRVFIELDTTHTLATIKVRMPDDVVTRIASDVLRQADDELNFEAFSVLNQSVDELGIDLLDNTQVQDKLSLLASTLSSKCAWHDHFDDSFFNAATSYIFFPQPILFLTDLPNGVKDAVDKIKRLIDNNEPIPSPLKHLLCGYEEGERTEVPLDPNEETPMGRIATVGGESKDVLLSLPANRDQLEIARKISYSDAVLVQGPPGTGKTHTIANLLGNLLAENKRILVTSATDKALSVLRDKLPEVIQPLCVTLLDTQAGSAAQDLRRAVEGICSTIEQRGFDVATLTKKECALTQERTQIMGQLSDVRQKLFNVLEGEYNVISYQGQAHTLSEWSKILHDNEHLQNTLPDVVSQESLTLSLEELQALYKSNATLNRQDEVALQGWLPASKTLPTPQAVHEWQLDQQEFNATVKDSPVRMTEQRHHVTFTIHNQTLDVPNSSIEQFKFDESATNDHCPAWLRLAQIESMLTEDAGHTHWHQLINQAQDFIELATQRRRDTQRPEVTWGDNTYVDCLRLSVEWFIQNASDGKLSWWKKTIGGTTVKQHQHHIQEVLVNGHAPSSPIDFQAILAEINWRQCRTLMANAWNACIGLEEGPTFESLGSRPEIEMPKFLKQLTQALNWWPTYGQPIIEQVKKLGLTPTTLFGVSETSSNTDWRDAVWTKTQTLLIPISKYLAMYQTEQALNHQRDTWMSLLTPPKDKAPAPLVKQLQKSILTDATAYATEREELIRLEDLSPIFEQRKQLLEKLATCAPTWAEYLRTRKEGWTQAFVPGEIIEAMRWHSIVEMVNNFNQLDYNQLQSESHHLSHRFRELTSQLAATRSWLHLARRLDHQPNLLQNLRGWMTTVQKIGKGTGKKATRLQASARSQAKACQKAIPVWVMTTQRALTTLDPKEKFDIIIIDEASQSDMTALAVLFMGKRIVVVGDDQQVSPMGIGVQDKHIADIQNEYLKDIPNAASYDENSSLYDIIKTVSSPVMLREHFRCASEIIDFSNQLSYDGKIVPLRDMSKCPITTHLVSYRVNGSRTAQDTNPAEAQAIVALIQSCIEQPEYKDKTFGVISMLSGKTQGQVALIEQMLKEAIPPKEYEKRRITVGISANFQGDERDIIFLSLVQSRDNAEKLMRREGFGILDSTKKRYNVAVSRARDQLWVVHSFDPDTDLAGDDLRRRLLMHIRNPHDQAHKTEAVLQRTESPFEHDVAKRLMAFGYQLIPQYNVGCYRLDFVVRDGDKSVALECDGERYHSSVEEIANDMERQAILERSGWKFIRVRGSEYYRNPEKAIDRIRSELSEYGIQPNYGHTAQKEENQELLSRVKMRAHAILRQTNAAEDATLVSDDIYAADLPKRVQEVANVSTPHEAPVVAPTNDQSPSTEHPPFLSEPLVTESPQSTTSCDTLATAPESPVPPSSRVTAAPQPHQVRPAQAPTDQKPQQTTTDRAPTMPTSSAEARHIENKGPTLPKSPVETTDHAPKTPTSSTEARHIEYKGPTPPKSPVVTADHAPKTPTSSTGARHIEYKGPTPPKSPVATTDHAPKTPTSSTGARHIEYKGPTPPKSPVATTDHAPKTPTSSTGARHIEYKGPTPPKPPVATADHAPKTPTSSTGARHIEYKGPTPPKPPVATADHAPKTPTSSTGARHIEYKGPTPPKPPVATADHAPKTPTSSAGHQAGVNKVTPQKQPSVLTVTTQATAKTDNTSTHTPLNRTHRKQQKMAERAAARLKANTNEITFYAQALDSDTDVSTPSTPKRTISKRQEKVKARLKAQADEEAKAKKKAKTPTQAKAQVSLAKVTPKASDSSPVLSTYSDCHWSELSAQQQQQILKEDQYMFELFKQKGWTVHDNRHAFRGCLWVLADREEFESTRKHLYDKFGLYFLYSEKLKSSRGNQPGWWLANQTIKRGKP